MSHPKTEADLQGRVTAVEKGGEAKYHAKNAENGKLFARERVRLLFDAGTFVEEGRFANSLKGGAPHEQGEGGPYGGLPADGVITGTGLVDGRRVAVIANDSTIKAGSWGPLTVEKILRQQEQVQKLQIPLVYLVDSAGARITTQVDMFPGRRGAGKIFYNEVQLSGRVPQICGLFGPSAAGGAYIPAFCDILIMVEGNASMYLGSPRMAEMVIGEKTTLEELGGAKMHCSVSGCGDVLVKTEQEAIAKIRSVLSYLPSSWETQAPVAAAKPAKPSKEPEKGIEALIPENENKPFDMHQVIERIVDEGSFWEVKQLFAKELLTGFARLDGKPIGIIANQPKHLGGVLFVDSADKATRFIQLCDAYGIPLLFLADVPGFMIGTKVERQGIIRSGAKMIFAVSEAQVPKISVVVRKAYGAGLYAMCGPGFEPDASLALPTAMIAVMGPSAAVNAVFYNKLMEKPEGPERDAFRKQLEEEYAEDVDLYKLASKAVVDDVVAPSRLRQELIARFAAYATKERRDPPRRHGVMPV